MKKKWELNYEIIILGVIVLSAIAFSLLQCPHNRFGSDECYSIRLARESMGDLLRLTANDVHPPLYYIFLKIVYRLLGKNAFSFHLSAALPYYAVLILGITVIYKEFGYRVSLIFVLFVSMMESSYMMAISARMYTLAMFFMFTLFLSGYELIKNEKRIYWWLFALSGIGAAYCHYFAFAMALIVYFGIFTTLVFRDRKAIGKCVLCSVMSLLGYAPWLVVFATTIVRNNKTGWIKEIPSILQIIGSIFGANLAGMILFLLFAGSIGIWIFTEIRDVCQKKKNEISNECIMCMIALATIIVMAAFSIGYSMLIRPIFLTRYLYPAYAALWLMFSVGLNRLWKGKKRYYMLAFVFFLCAIGIPANLKSYASSKMRTEQTEQVLDYMSDRDPDDLMISKRCELTAEVFHYYFEENRQNPLEEHYWDDIDHHGTAYYFNYSEMNQETLDAITQNNFEIIEGPTEGYLGDVYVYIYKLYRG